MPIYYKDKEDFAMVPKEQIERFIYNSETLEQKAMFAVLWLTGCRIGELVQLTRDHIIVKDNEVHLMLRTEKRHDNKIRENSFKDTTPFLNLILEHRNTCRKYLVFHKTVRMYQLYFAKIDMKLNGKRTLTPHYLRHSRITFFAHIKKASAWELQAWYGTRTTQIFDVYVIPQLPERFKDAIL